MILFRRLAVASTGATFLLITIGGLVRATKSGLGCGPNWPDCPGSVTRALIIEFSHRAVAVVVVFLIAALAITAVRHFRGLRSITMPAVAAFGLVVFQAILGAVVVWLELEAASVVLHLATALGLLALLIYLAVTALVMDDRLETTLDLWAARRSAWTAGLVFVLLLVGSYVTGSGAGDVFGDWPLMNGAVVPDLGSGDQAAHFAHRILAAVTGIVILAALVGLAKRKETLVLQFRLAKVASTAFVVEAIVGALNVWSDLNAFWVTLHLGLGALVWSALVGGVVVSHPALQPAGAPRSVQGSPAVLGAS
ncbi:MAG: COX15/CtaA family protein [Actinomycetota bacterium]|nr:COX15/CtaA family protein [Actinomycetota bacterium]